MKILCFGELLFDHIEGVFYLGGAPNNFAGHSAMLGAETYLITSIGNDELGDRGLKQALSHGLKDTYIKRTNDHPTGVVEVHLQNGIPRYEIAYSAWDYIDLDSHDIASLKQKKFDIFYFGTLAQRTENNAAAVQKLMRELSYTDSFFDVNLRLNFYSKGILDTSMQHTTILKLNDEELPIISSLLLGKELEPAEFYHEITAIYPVKIVLLTCGKEGAYFFSPETNGHIIPKPVPVVDTVGAGDSFSAGFIRVYKATRDVEKAIQFASDLADFVVGKQGALPEYDETVKNRLAELGI